MFLAIQTPKEGQTTMILPDPNHQSPTTYIYPLFFMYEFKIRRCHRSCPHDWTDCPYAHPGEKANRRDPRKHRYSATACAGFRRAGRCRRGDSCEFSHGVFECWLHPDRYRTQKCKDGKGCHRKVCFFAHSLDELRLPLSSVSGVNLNFSVEEMLEGMNQLKMTTSPAPAPAPAVTLFDSWEEPLVRVESGKGVRAKIAEMLIKQSLM